MKKEKSPKKEQEQSAVQGDSVIHRANQVQPSFLYVPVKDPFEKRKISYFSERDLYRVIKIK